MAPWSLRSRLVDAKSLRSALRTRLVPSVAFGPLLALSRRAGSPLGTPENGVTFTVSRPFAYRGKMTPSGSHWSDPWGGFPKRGMGWNGK